MKEVRRRGFLLSVLLGIPALAETGKDTVRGTLVQQKGRKPSLRTKEGKTVFLDGDEPTRGVLNDPRLAGSDFEALGRFESSDTFRIDPIHLRAMFVYKDGKRLFITYWCEVCAIRTYTPGKCWCCQEETAVDLREHDQP
jgi:hypothetical protein